MQTVKASQPDIEDDNAAEAAYQMGYDTLAQDGGEELRAVAQALQGHIRTLRLSGRNDGMVEDMERAVKTLSRTPNKAIEYTRSNKKPGSNGRNWVTFNVWHEDADEVERRLK